jgi:hypothetical protein
MLFGKWAHVTNTDVAVIRDKLIEYIKGGGTKLGGGVTANIIRGMNDEGVLELAERVAGDIGVADILRPPKQS